MIKVLFVCRANVGRSQIASGLFNYLEKSSPSESAGTIVDLHGQTLRERQAYKVIECMQEIGIDISQYRIRQIDQEYAKGFERIIVMAEKNTLPQWLSDDKKMEYWDILDPKGSDLNFHRKTRDEIRSKVERLISELR